MLVFGVPSHDGCAKLLLALFRTGVLATRDWQTPPLHGVDGVEPPLNGIAMCQNGDVSPSNEERIHTINASPDPAVESLLLFAVGYGDMTINLHDELAVNRDGVRADRFAILGRQGSR